MPVDTHLQDITHTIQLAVAPVFLLTALATTLGVLANRLGRIVDRARRVEQRLASEPGAERAASLAELTLVSHRARLVHWGLTAGTCAALLVCLLIAVAFLGYLFDRDFGAAVATLFVLAMLAFVVALLLFLREVFLAIDTLRFGLPPEIRELESPLPRGAPPASSAP
jgi:hypothetical protein